MVESFIPIDFTGPITATGMLAHTSFNMVSPNAPTYVLDPNPLQGELDMQVMKHGRTTGLTQRRITAVDYSAQITFASGTATFDGLFVVESQLIPFSMGGDSGALVVDVASKRPIGIILAGAVDETFVVPIQPIMKALNIDKILGDAR